MLLDYLYQKLVKNKEKMVVFLDLKKAFDTVILLRKLENIGTINKPLDLYKSYLKNWTCITVLKDKNQILIK